VKVGGTAGTVISRKQYMNLISEQGPKVSISLSEEEGFFMKKTIIIAIAVIVSLLVVAVGLKTIPHPQSVQTIKQTATVKPTASIKNYFSYKGLEGKNALELLKQKTSVEEAGIGFVASINNRPADKNKHEYWAFYVNGKLASVGAADYITKNSDTIEWKIEKY